MLRYPLLIITGLILMTGAATAQVGISVTWGQPFPNSRLSHPGQCPPGYFYCNHHRGFCNHNPNLYRNRRVPVRVVPQYVPVPARPYANYGRPYRPVRGHARGHFKRYQRNRHCR